MIHSDEMMRLLLDACPSFRPEWDAFLEEWRDDPEGLPLYGAMSELARHLIVLLEQDDTATLERVFDVVERLIVEGDEDVRGLATIGLLEDLSNTGLHKQTHRDDFLPLLGPESRIWWDKIVEFWEGGASDSRGCGLALSVIALVFALAVVTGIAIGIYYLTRL